MTTNITPIPNASRGNGKLVAVGIGIGLIVLVLVLRFSLSNSGPVPTATPTPTGLERYFAFKVVGKNIDPIVVERERGVFDSAVQLLRDDPDYFDGWITIGGIKKAMGDFEGAADVWDYAGQIRPANSLSFNNLGDLYTNFLYDPVQAEAAYRQAISNSAGEDRNTFFWASLFDLYRYKINDQDKAFAVIDEGIIANPARVELPLRAARHAAQIGERAKALAYYQQALRLAPKDAALQQEFRQYRDGR
ncbi:MAG: hypothetical protein Q7S23_00355 [bacterium]|nr:hypothetical protein [bacterium]